ncbi:MAG: adenosylmethionine decarboxylase [Myxococcota bacterium]|jgi:S-adenosylmethionine decarboxylase
MKPAGTHILIDIWGANPDALNDPELLERILSDAASGAGLNVLGARFAKFNPQGASGAVLLSESHIAIHTWPETGFAAVDLFTCGSPVAAEAACKAVAERLGAASVLIRSVGRGGTGGED